MQSEQYEPGGPELRPDHGLFNLARLAAVQAELAANRDESHSLVLDTIGDNQEDTEVV